MTEILKDPYRMRAETMQYRPDQLWVGALRAERERKGNAVLEAGQHVRRAGSGDHPDRGYRPHSLHWDSSLLTSGRIWALFLLEPILFEVFLSSKFWFWVAVTTVINILLVVMDIYKDSCL